MSRDHMTSHNTGTWWMPTVSLVAFMRTHLTVLLHDQTRTEQHQTEGLLAWRTARNRSGTTLSRRCNHVWSHWPDAGTSSQKHHGAIADGFSSQQNGNSELLYIQFAFVLCLMGPCRILLLRQRSTHRGPRSSTNRERDALQHSN